MAKLTLREWQAADVEAAGRALQETGGALLAWCMGSGKTLAGSEVLGRLGGADRVLIVAPLSTHDSWIERVREQGAAEPVVANRKNKGGQVALFNLEFGLPGWYVVSPAFMTRSDVSTWPRFDALVIDEVHQVAEKSSRGLKNILKIETDARLALSGTPARNKVENLWGVSRILWPHLNAPGEVADDKFWRWSDARLESKTIYTGRKDQWGKPVTAKEFTGEKEPGGIFRHMPFVSVHLARERCCEFHPEGVLASLEEPAVMHETVTLLPEQKRAIRDMEDFMVTFLEDNPMVADIPLTSQQRIRQCILGVPTVEWTKDEEDEDVQTVSFDPDCKSPFLDRLVDILSTDDEPFIVWSDSQKFVEVVTKRLNEAGIPAAEYSGKRKADRAEFGKSYRVLVAVPSSLATGSDGIQEVCRSEVWLSRDLDETTNEQGEARLFRMGQEAGIRRWIFHDDRGISEGRFGDAVMKRLALNQSLRVDTPAEMF